VGAVVFVSYQTESIYYSLQSLSRLLLIGLSLVVLSLCGCRPVSVEDSRPVVSWINITASFQSLNPEITVFEGRDENIPVNAWYAKIRTKSDAIRVSVESAVGEAGVESVSDFSRRNNACLAVNGGYFLKRNDVHRPIGLVVSNGSILNDATHRISNKDTRYEALRSALGINSTGDVEIAWVSSRNDSVFAWADAVPNQQGFPARMLPRSMSSYWPVEQAVAAGPVLVVDGQIDVHIDSEIFFDSPIPNTHPRTAAGITVNGDLLIMVVDGRQAASRGVNLDELAGMMLSIGAVRAINLDGGGSSAFVVADSLLNRPIGTGSERPVNSALIIHCLP
jgi:exopolysaccharide biosynthesis protein